MVMKPSEQKDSNPHLASLLRSAALPIKLRSERVGGGLLRTRRLMGEAVSCMPLASGYTITF